MVAKLDASSHAVQYVDMKGINTELHGLLSSQQRQISALTAFAATIESINGSSPRASVFVGSTGSVDTNRSSRGSGAGAGAGAAGAQATPLESYLRKQLIHAAIDSIALQRSMGT